MPDIPNNQPRWARGDIGREIGRWILAEIQAALALAGIHDRTIDGGHIVGVAPTAATSLATYVNGVLCSEKPGLNLSDNFECGPTADPYFTGLSSSDIDLSDTTVVPGVYGDADFVPSLTVDAKGRITNVVEIGIVGGGGGGASTLDDLTDVIITSPATGAVLKYDGAHWIDDADTGFANPMTTPADLIVGTTAGAAARLAKGSDGQVLTVDPTTHLLVWATPAAPGAGTVTSVALTVPAGLSVSGSPITGSGTLAVTWATEAANLVLAGPVSGGVATPTFRALVAADMPAGIVANPMTTANDIVVGGASGVPARLAKGTDGQVLTVDPTTHDLVWATPSSPGTGTVTSVALTMPTGFSVGGSPVTGAGTLAVTESNQNANLVKAGPGSGAAATPTYRSLVTADLPAHASTHNAGGSDAMAIDAAAGTGSLRTLGSSATQAASGTDSRLSDARTPTAHATSHQPGGSDTMAVDAAAGTGSLRTLGIGAAQAASGTDSRLSDSRAPNGSAGGDLTGSYPSPTLVTSGVSAAVYGSANQVAQVTLDAKGRATLAANVSIVPSNNMRRGVVALQFGDGVNVIAATEMEQEFQLNFSGVIEGWEIGAKVSGSIVFDIWKDVAANYPPVVGDTITASAKPTLTTAVHSSSYTPTGWTTAFARGDWFKVHIDSASNVTRVTLAIHYIKDS